MNHFIQTISPEQWALAAGFLTWLGHSVLDRHKNLSRDVNYFIVRFMTVVVPAATAVATDPHISAIVHSYFPALIGFFAAYQGLYVLAGTVAGKWAELKAQMAPVAAETPQEF